MFRANRIGTPVFFENTVTESAIDWTINANNVGDEVVTANVINSVPILDLGYTNLTWLGAAENLAAGGKFALVQQVTVTEPTVGDAVGIEINGAIDILAATNIGLVPVFFKATTAAGALLGSIQANAGAVRFAQGRRFTGAANIYESLSYKEQVVIKSTLGQVAGTYCHGFLIYNHTAANYALTNFHMQCSARQLNDQQNVQYRDTRR